VPVPIAAVVLGGGLVVLDSLLADLGEARAAAGVEDGQAEAGTAAT
jgi:hypothetical protein